MIKNEPFEVAFSAIRRYECPLFVAENAASYDNFLIILCAFSIPYLPVHKNIWMDFSMYFLDVGNITVKKFA